MENVKKRELLPDVLRGFAIFLVVLGHCIQECSGNDFKINTAYFQDRGYQLIYSFHMPLFMLLSGYFAWDSMEKVKENKERWKLLARRSFSLLVPILAWTGYDYLVILLRNGYDYLAFQSLFLFTKCFLMSFLTNSWFLWAVFWCFNIVFFMHYYLNDSKLLYFVGFLTLFFIPDGLGLGAYKYMMPYFITAFYFRGWNNKQESKKFWKTTNEWILIIGLGIVYWFLFLFFDEYSFIYLSGYKLVGKDILRQLGIDFYRMLIGFVGSGFFILIWKKILECVSEKRVAILSLLGKNSLGIYLISGYVIIQAGETWEAYFSPNYILNMMQACIVILVTCGITIVLKKIPILKYFVGR